MNPQRLTIITAVIAILAIAGFFLFNRNRAPAEGVSEATSTPANIDPSKLSYDNQPALGDANAPVKLAIFEDFKCPACKNFEEVVWPKIERDYINSGQVQAYFIYYQIIPNSTTAGIASECVYEQNPDLFWDYKAIVYRSQENEAVDWATSEKMLELARTYVPDVNADELETCLDEKRHDDKIKADKAMGEAIGVSGTPTLFINGEKFETQAQTYDEFYEQIKAALDAAASAN
ncbi:MAG: thioredoxin domain-containing protein [Trueperaceae bacterium]